MTGIRARAPGRVRGAGGRLRSFWAGIAAVGSKELRGRMRGRRAFAVLTVYLLLLGAFSFGIYQYLRDSAAAQTGTFLPGMPGEPFPGGGQATTVGTALSATIGHAIFSGLLIVETLLILVLAPAFTSGAISMEREKQTLDLLVTTPLSTFGMVIGKLLSALGWVFLLILASVPMASIVFAFGGVGPEDLLRGYLLLFAVAFGTGAIGLFVSALVRRTQTATVLSFVIVLALTMGSLALHEFLVVTTRQAAGVGFVGVQARHRAPEALLWLNPLAADMDLVCTTVPSGSHDSCRFLANVTGRPYFAAGAPGGAQGCPPGAECFPADLPVEEVVGDGPEAPGSKPWIGDVAPDEPVAQPQPLSLGFPRDTFWPRSAASFGVVGLVLVLLSTQLIAPSRRLRLPRRRGHAVPAVASPAAATDPATDHDQPSSTTSEVQA